MKESFQPLTDAEWEVIEKLLNDQRQRFYDLRRIFNILFWVVWTGCQWREVNRTWGIPWQSAYYYFRRWKRNNCFDYLILLCQIGKGIRKGEFQKMELLVNEKKLKPMPRSMPPTFGVDEKRMWANVSSI